MWWYIALLALQLIAIIVTYIIYWIDHETENIWTNIFLFLLSLIFVLYLIVKKENKYNIQNLIMYLFVLFYNLYLFLNNLVLTFMRGRSHVAPFILNLFSFIVGFFWFFMKDPFKYLNTLAQSEPITSNREDSSKISGGYLNKKQGYKILKDSCRSIFN